MGLRLTKAPLVIVAFPDLDGDLTEYMALFRLQKSMVGGSPGPKLPIFAKNAIFGPHWL